MLFSKLKKIPQLLERQSIQLLIIVLAVTLAYINIFQNEFVFDDPTFIVQWKEIKSWDNIIPFLKGSVPTGHGGLYRPLRSIFYTASYHIWGTSTFGYHLQSILTILASTLLVYLTTIQITRKKLLAFLVALLFGLHPMHIESITFITASFDSIGNVFFFLAFYLYLKAKDQSNHHKLFYLSSVLSASAAFFTYEMTLTLPILIILHDLCFNRTQFRNYSKTVIPDLPPKASLAFSGIRNLYKWILLYLPYIVVGVVYTFVRVSLLHITVRGEYTAGSFYITMLTMTRVITKYFSLLLFPINSSVNHQITPGIMALIWAESDSKILRSQSIFQLDIFLSIVLIFTLLALALINFKKHPLITFSILWIFISLSPVLNIIPQGALITERYFFLPSYGFILIQSFLLYSLYHRLSRLNFPLAIKLAPVLLTILISVSYLGLTVKRNSEWKDSERLWTSAYKLAPNSFLITTNVAVNYDHQGKFDLALKYFKNLVALAPENPRTHNYLGTAYMKIGQLDKATLEYQKAINLQPDQSDFYGSLGLVYVKQEKLDLAIKALQKALEISNNSDPAAYFNLGVVYGKQKKIDLAITAYQKAVELNKDYADPHNNLGLIYLDQGKLEETIIELQKAISITPKSPQFYFNLAKAYEKAGNLSLAIQQYQQAIELDQKVAEPHNNLGIIYTGLGKIDLAVQEFNIAIDLDKEYAEPHFNLGLIYKTEDKNDLAKAEFKKGLLLKPNTVISQQIDEISDKN